MKKIAKSSREKLNKNIRAVLSLYIVLFAAIIVYLGYSVITFGDEWSNTPYNPRIQKTIENITEGSIFDRNGTLLASSESDKSERSYIEDKTSRLALSHVLGIPTE